MNTDISVGSVTIREVKGLRADFEEKLASDNGREWVEAFKLFLKEDPRKAKREGAKVVTPQRTNLLRKITEVTLLATTKKKTSDCFLGSRYYYRDPDLDNWLPKMEPSGKEGQLTIYQLEKELSFKGVAQAILGVDEASLNNLAKGFIDRGHVVVLPQIELLIERTDAGENTGLRTDGRINFFFVENEEGGVSVISVCLYDDKRFSVCIYRLNDGRLWSVMMSQFFSRKS